MDPIFIAFWCLMIAIYIPLNIRARRRNFTRKVTRFESELAFRGIPILGEVRSLANILMTCDVKNPWEVSFFVASPRLFRELQFSRETIVDVITGGDKTWRASSPGSEALAVERVNESKRFLRPRRTGVKFVYEFTNITGTPVAKPVAGAANPRETSQTSSREALEPMTVSFVVPMRMLKKAARQWDKRVPMSTEVSEVAVDGLIKELLSGKTPDNNK